MHYIHRSSLLVLAYEKIQLDSNVCKWCFVLGWSSWAKAVCMSLYVCVIAKQTKNKNKTTLLDLYSLSIIILLCCYEYRTVPRTVRYSSSKKKTEKSQKSWEAKPHDVILLYIVYSYIVLSPLVALLPVDSILFSCNKQARDWLYYHEQQASLSSLFLLAPVSFCRRRDRAKRDLLSFRSNPVHERRKGSPRISDEQ